MIPLIDENRRALEDMCRRHRVRRLELFGSAAGKGMESMSGDLDFLVEFHELGDGGYADAYFGMLDDLRALSHREVDLVVASTVKNPYLREGIERSMTCCIQPDRGLAFTVEPIQFSEDVTRCVAAGVGR